MLSRTPRFTPAQDARPGRAARIARRAVAAILLAGLAGGLAGCVVYPAGPHHGWCYWHPYRCR